MRWPFRIAGIPLALTCWSCGGKAAEAAAVIDEPPPCARPRGVLTPLFRYSDTPGLVPGIAAVVGDTTYVATNVAIWRSAALGTTAVKLATYTDQVAWLTAYGGGVWWTAVQRDSIGSVTSIVVDRLDGDTGALASFSVTDADCPTTGFALAYSERGVIAFGECVWLLSYDDGMLRKRRLGQPHPGSISRAVVHGDNVYFVRGTQVTEVGITTGHERVIPGTVGVGVFAMDGQHLYWTYEGSTPVSLSGARQLMNVRSLRDGSLERTRHLDLDTEELFAVGDALFLGALDTAHPHGATWRAPEQDGHGDLLVDRVPFAADRCALYFGDDEGISYYAP